MKPSVNKVALVTGASSGIGKAFANYLAGKGYNMILTGRRMDQLKCLRQQLEAQFGISVRIVCAELSKECDVKKLIAIIKSTPNIQLLVNNAGFGSGVEFERNAFEEHLRMIKVHVIASLELIYAALPRMIRSKEGNIINVSSLAAFMPAPGSSMYSATKLFLKSFTESLFMEVHKYGINVQCLCPGFTRTEFHSRRSAGQIGNNHSILWMDAEKVVEKSMKSLSKGCVICLPGLLNRTLAGISSLVPRRLYYRIMENSGNIKIAPRFLDGIKQFIEKTVSFLFPADADQVGFPH